MAEHSKQSKHALLFEKLKANSCLSNVDVMTTKEGYRTNRLAEYIRRFKEEYSVKIERLDLRDKDNKYIDTVYVMLAEGS